MLNVDKKLFSAFVSIFFLYFNNLNLITESVKADPIPDDTTGVLQGLEAVSVRALVFEGSDDPLDHPVLFRAVGRDELLLRPIAFDQGCVASACEDQPVVVSEQERCLNSAEMAVSSDQSLLQC